MPTVDINGHEVEYDPTWSDSWDVAELLSRASDDSPVSDYEKLGAMFRIVELCTGLTHDEYVEMAGGGATNRDEMAQRLGGTIAQLVSKN